VSARQARPRGPAGPRFRGTSLAPLAAVAAAVLLIVIAAGEFLVYRAVAGPTPSPSPVDRQAGPALRSIDPAPYQLHTEPSKTSLLRGIENVYPRVTLPAALDAAPSRTATCPAAARQALPITPSTRSWFCWSGANATTADWHPRGIDGSGAAAVNLGLNGRRVLAAAWQATKGGEVRISLVDVTEDGKHPYVEVRPVVLDAAPSGPPRYSPVTGVGGLMWAGDFLWVSDGGGGIHVFDVRRLLQVSGATYIMPRIRYLRQPQPAHGCTDTRSPAPSNPGDPFCFEWLSLDREPGEAWLLAGERRPESAGGRVLRFRLDPKSLLLPVGEDPARPAQAYQVPVAGVGGGVERHGTLYLGGGSAASRGRLYVATPGQPVMVLTCTPGGRVSDACWSIGSQDMAYWPNRNEIWSLTDAVIDGRPYRVVFQVATSALPTTSAQR
jgi:hypothetical protein